MSGPNDKKLRAIIHRVVTGCTQAGVTLTRTKLVKLVFLADYFYKERFGRTISGLSYTYYFYGPYSRTLIDIVQSMVPDFIMEKETVLSSGSICYLYLPGPRPVSNVLEPDEEATIDEIVREFGRRNLSSILSKVYELPVMQHAKPLETVLS